MRATREAAAATRSRIVATASRLFRKHGLETTSIADVMQAAGLTHGGFYKHFPNKDALAKEAVRKAFGELSATLESPDNKASDVRDRYVDRYLSVQHVSHPDRGCPVAALGADSSRSSKNVKAEFKAGMEDVVARFMAAGNTATGPKERAEAIRQLALMVGAVVVARSCGDVDLAQEVLAAAKEDLGKAGSTP